jgi:tRNA uridine 5-carboxymethylaminomethyl modification enzyme
MFTSRAEYRLKLREDNADLRLSEIGRGLGCVPDRRWDAFARKRDALAHEQTRLRNLWAAPGNALGRALEAEIGLALSRETSALDLLRRPELDYARLMDVAGLGPGVADPSVAQQLEVQAKYAGYLERQDDEIERQQRHQGSVIPLDFDYAEVRGLSAEARQKLTRVRPETIGQAQRIAGITPAAISLLLVHLKRLGARRVA